MKEWRNIICSGRVTRMGQIEEWILKYWVEVLLGLITGALTAAYRNLSKKIKKRSEEDKASREAMLSLLDDRMGQMMELCKKSGHVTREQLRRYERMYRAYHALGGNGAVTIEHEQFANIPIED